MYYLKMGDLYFVGFRGKSSAWAFELRSAMLYPRHEQVMMIYQYFLERNPDMKDALCIIYDSIMTAPVAPVDEGATSEPQEKTPKVGS